MTTTLKINGTEKEYIIDTGSLISTVGYQDNERIRNSKGETPIRRCKQDRSQIWGEIPVNFEYENNKQKMQLLITERNDITPLLGMDWLNKIKVTIGKIRWDDNSQSQKGRIIEKFPDLFRNITTIKDAEITIEAVGKENKK